MLDPNHVIVLNGQTPVFEDGYGWQDVYTVAVADYYDEHTLPSTESLEADISGPAIKAHGPNGDIYIPQDEVHHIEHLCESLPDPNESTAPDHPGLPDDHDCRQRVHDGLAEHIQTTHDASLHAEFECDVCSRSVTITAAPHDLEIEASEDKVYKAVADAGGDELYNAPLVGPTK